MNVKRTGDWSKDVGEVASFGWNELSDMIDTSHLERDVSDGMVDGDNLLLAYITSSLSFFNQHVLNRDDFVSKVKPYLVRSFRLDNDDVEFSFDF